MKMCALINYDLYCPGCGIHEKRAIGDVRWSSDSTCAKCGNEMVIIKPDVPGSLVGETAPVKRTVKILANRMDVLREKAKEIVANDHAKEILVHAKSATSSILDEASKLAKDVMRSDMAKDAATGAAIGAAVAIPVPIIGPAAGAVIGAGIGVYKNLNKNQVETHVPKKTTNSDMDIYETISKLDELRKNSAITEDEYQNEKNKLFKKTS